ncbi:uncharacterized protein LOC115877359 [Sitophilus oryzae]|uniref:Uncharacterized protein LOC115877359 n=1 Tax=Sitophilus oryzae TaxID=7048 RepID=A0A6J2XF26_SITOR|nr:uncharacterized protein LOC115877359 [Sitophilus oryzae]
MHILTVFWIFCAVFLMVASLPAPLSTKTEKDISTGISDNVITKDTRTCIPTPWGCVDINDPAVRPNKQQVMTKDSKTCIPTPWGCLNPNDPAVRPQLKKIESDNLINQ